MWSDFLLPLWPHFWLFLSPLHSSVVMEAPLIFWPTCQASSSLCSLPWDILCLQCFSLWYLHEQLLQLQVFAQMSQCCLLQATPFKISSSPVPGLRSPFYSMLPLPFLHHLLTHRIIYFSMFAVYFLSWVTGMSAPWEQGFVSSLMHSWTYIYQHGLHSG